VSIRDVSVRLGADGQLWYRTTGDLTDRWVGMPNPLLEQTRTYYGRALTPEAIEQTIVMADHGFMRALTDLTYEATRIDPHFSMCDSKRLRAVLAAKTEVVPASGSGIDADKGSQVRRRSSPAAQMDPELLAGARAAQLGAQARARGG
jgi:hypothetical protein